MHTWYTSIYVVTVRMERTRTEIFSTVFDIGISDLKTSQQERPEGKLYHTYVRERSVHHALIEQAITI